MKHFILFGLVLLSTSLFSQEQDTIYYNADWDEIEDKEYAAFYRWNDVENNLVVDYYITGEVQMKEEVIDLVDEVKNGKTTWFHKNGEISRISNYIKDSLDGTTIHYAEDGTKTDEYTHSNGKPVGDSRTWYEDGTKRDEYIVQDNANIKIYTAYYLNGKVQRTGEIIDKKRSGKWKFYTENGDLHFSSTYEKGEVTEVDLVKKELGFYQYGYIKRDTGYTTRTYFPTFETKEEYKVTRPLIENNISLLKDATDFDHFIHLLGYSGNWYVGHPKRTEPLKFIGTDYMKKYLFDAMREEKEGSLLVTFKLSCMQYELDNYNRKQNIPKRQYEATLLMIDSYEFLKKERQLSAIPKIEKLIKLEGKGKLESFIKNY